MKSKQSYWQKGGCFLGVFSFFFLGFHGAVLAALSESDLDEQDQVSCASQFTEVSEVDSCESEKKELRVFCGEIENPDERGACEQRSKLANAILANKIETAKLDTLIPNYAGPKTISSFSKTIMKFLGIMIILASTLGFAVGGAMLIFSAGSESLMERGRKLLVMSLVGLVVTLLAYLIVTLMQQFLYQFGNSI